VHSPSLDDARPSSAPLERRGLCEPTGMNRSVSQRGVSAPRVEAGMRRWLWRLVSCGVAAAAACQPPVLDITVPLLAQGATYTATTDTEGSEAATLTPQDEGIVEIVDIAVDDVSGFTKVTMRALAEGETGVEASGPVEGEF